MAHKHPIYDTDPHFKIDGDTRAIINMSDVKVALMQGDHNSERFTFEIPRYVDGHDMSLCNICQIHYLNVGSSTRATNAGIYEVEDLQFDPKDEQNRVVLSWLISSNVTMYVGSLSFVIRFGCSTDGLIDYIWNTAVCSGIMISSSICNSETVVQDYADILEQWRGKLGDSVTALKSDLSQLSEEISNCIITPTTAAVGQTVVVKAVDDNSKPTEWETYDIPSTVTDDHINELISTALNKIGVAEEGAY